MPRKAGTLDDRLAQKSASGRSTGVSSRALSAAKQRLDTQGAKGALQNARDVIHKATKGGKKIAEGSAEETSVWRAVGRKGPVNLGGLRQMVRGAAKGLLSPAALAEGVAGRVAVLAAEKDRMVEKRNKSPLKRPSRKA